MKTKEKKQKGKIISFDEFVQLVKKKKEAELLKRVLALSKYLPDV